MKFEIQVPIGMPTLKITKAGVLAGNKMAAAAILENRQKAVTQPFMNRFWWNLKLRFLIRRSTWKLTKAGVMTRNKMAAAAILENLQKAAPQPFMNRFWWNLKLRYLMDVLHEKHYNCDCLLETVWLSVKNTKTANINRKKWQSLLKEVVIGYWNTKTAKIPLGREGWGF